MKTYKTKMREMAGEDAAEEEGKEGDGEEGAGATAGTGDSAQWESDKRLGMDMDGFDSHDWTNFGS